MCLVYLLDLYLEKLPPFVFDKEVFYCQPKPTAPSGDKPWYDAVAVGKSKLASMVSDICEDAGVKRCSLRATGATTLFQGDIPEKIIQKTTGHQFLKSLHMYERVSDDQHKTVSKLMRLPLRS